MGVSRRWFIGGAASFGALQGCRLLSGSSSCGGRPNVTFGVLSDVHLENPGDEDTFLAALAYFHDQGVDGVMIAGDIANHGLYPQLKRAADGWFKVFPDGKARDGRPVAQLWVLGNHDVQGWTWDGRTYKDEAEKRALAIGYADNRARMWEELFHEPYRPIWAKTVKGYTFLGTHWGHEKNLDAYLAAHADELGLAAGKPFFYAQHPHPANTVQGPWAWGHDGGAATRALAKYPNAVAFSGHSHYSLTDERTIWQGAFTSVGTSSLRYIFAQYGRENGEDHNGVCKQMPLLPEADGRQGLLVRVYDDRCTFARRDFLHGESLGPDWVVPFDETRPFAFAPRAARAVAPAFAADARVTVTRGPGKNRRGQACEQLTVAFPAARPSTTSRVHDYEVQALAYHEDVDYPVAVKRVLSESYFLSPTREAASGRIVFAIDELKGAKEVRFAVRPLECFGKKGPEIFSDMIKL